MTHICSMYDGLKNDSHFYVEIEDRNIRHKSGTSVDKYGKPKSPVEETTMIMLEKLIHICRARIEKGNGKEHEGWLGLVFGRFGAGVGLGWLRVGRVLAGLVSG